MQKQKIVLASGNTGKIREMTALLAQLPIDLVPQTELGIESVEETGLTFVENAILKARHAAEQSGLPALADDSGLCIQALNNAPGIISARYAGPDATDTILIQKVLKEMLDVPEGKRQASFHSVLAFLQTPDDPAPIICDGRWHGHIIHEAHGTQGFGYDPIFYVPDHNCTAAELDPTLKNQISHRGQAMADLLNHFSNTTA